MDVTKPPTNESGDAGALRSWAARAVACGREAWPTLSVSEDELIRIATLRCFDQRDQLDLAELYLAAACERGDESALAELYHHHFRPVISSLRRMGITSDHCADVWQMLCERLLVSHDGAPPRIVQYAGQGKLGGLVRVAATRVALNWIAKDKRTGNDDGWVEQLPALGADPELRSIKEEHGAALKQELEAALSALSARERMILRLHLIERVGIDGIARLCMVHRSTAARMIARTKQQLGSALRTRLARRWGVGAKELPALEGMIDSQIDLSLHRLLGP